MPFPLFKTTDLEEDLIYWIAVNNVLSEYLEPTRKIIDHFSPIKKVLSAERKDLLSLGLDKKTVGVLLSSKSLDQAKKEIDWLKKKGYTPLSFRDQRYPALLRETFNPPLVLYCAGRVETLEKPSVSMVGARKPTPYGRAVAENLASQLASKGLVIVSGMARGVDSIAHWGALKGGRTIAVLGSGLNNIYPPENRRLFNKITETGAVVTEYSKDRPPLGRHFPMRNRIISGLSLASVVLEATLKSGSLITARLALDQNREVMAVPGNITSKLSQGTNWLIQNGAKAITSWEDVVEEFPEPYKEQFSQKKHKMKEIGPSLSPREKIIYDLLKTDSITHIDELVTASSLSVPEALSVLLKLELEDMIHQSPGKFYQRKL